MKKESKPHEKIEYEKIMNGNVKEQLIIAKLFKKNMEIVESHDYSVACRSFVCRILSV